VPVPPYGGRLATTKFVLLNDHMIDGKHEVGVVLVSARWKL
jgi:hypothetical protein